MLFKGNAPRAPGVGKVGDIAPAGDRRNVTGTDAVAAMMRPSGRGGLVVMIRMLVAQLMSGRGGGRLRPAHIHARQRPLDHEKGREKETDDDMDEPSLHVGLMTEIGQR